jgi:hypothetical protein
MVIQNLQAANQTTIELSPNLAPEAILPVVQFPQISLTEC